MFFWTAEWKSVFLLSGRLLMKFGRRADSRNVTQLSANDLLGDVVPPSQTCDGATNISTSSLSAFQKIKTGVAMKEPHLEPSGF